MTHRQLAIVLITIGLIGWFHRTLDRSLGIVYAPDGPSRLALWPLGQPRSGTVSAEHLERDISLQERANAVDHVDYSPDGKTLATASRDKAARVWDAKTGRLLLTLGSQVRRVMFSPDSESILTTGYRQHTAEVWNAKTGRLLLTLDEHSIVNGAAYSPDGSTIVTSSQDATAKLRDAHTGALLHTLKDHTGVVVAMAYSLDGKKVVTGSLDSTARIWDTNSGGLLLTVQHPRGVSSVAYSPDGKTIVTGGKDDTAKVWDVESGKLLLTLHNLPVITHAAYTPDGKTIVAVSLETAYLWDAVTGELLHTLEKSSVIGTRFAVSPDSKMIVTGTFNDANRARVWDVRTGHLVQILEGHRTDVFSIAYSPDSTTIVTGSADGTARMWDAQTGRTLFILQNPPLRGECADAPPTQFAVGMRGTVLPATPGRSATPVNVRVRPTQKSIVLSQLKTGEMFTVLDGPKCADGYLWWQIKPDVGLIGWVAEGDSDHFFIDPVTAPATKSPSK